MNEKLCEPNFTSSLPRPLSKDNKELHGHSFVDLFPATWLDSEPMQVEPIWLAKWLNESKRESNVVAKDKVKFEKSQELFTFDFLPFPFLPLTSRPSS